MTTGLSRRSLFTALTGVIGSAVIAETVVARPAAATPGDGASVKLAVPPLRISDTRVDTPGVKLAGGHSLSVFVPGLIGNGVVGALLNVTVTNTEGGGFVRVDADNSTATNSTSNINWWGPGLTLANLVAVPAEGTRGITVTAGGTGKTDVLIDLVGFLTNP
jgi:hypothetical protein